MPGSDSPIIAIFVVSALIVLLLVGVIVAFVLLYQRRVLQQQMLSQDREVAFQRELLSATLQSQEAERSRIAKDLHDSVGVMLSTLQLVIKRYGSRADTPEQKDAMVAQSTSIIDSTITTVRRISHDLLPPELELMGLQAALEHLVWRINEVGNLHLTLNFCDYAERFPSHYEITFYRIVQELLNNTLKHSGASSAVITIQHHATDLVLRYTDNGKGIAPELIGPERGTRGGLGLHNIETRAHLLGASVRWDSEATSGMSIEFHFPLPFTLQSLHDTVHAENQSRNR